ncbi:hypothetical protein SAMN02745883_01093 [Caminicella sporogenes DSM 14501]|uniref:Uncharacterized protein n=1 Tax=Caminicella sporogenes DSM 14501 TaxID=1121266 RepID=A0A1M6P3U8_9FIRM|nr:hypothetical protein [Caminicella sporogenes]RKD21541.1 hypothetical protein BET04_07380 [Caminicella sporogenes]WIF94183.1 hypothetical protein QNI18_07670 [Caminicella sporogenes]SHK02562.1 hypothetical protein SAMN02745883_01093 [Caminicella sporogenes DSM 14501]
MIKNFLKDREFERNKEEILKMAGILKSNSLGTNFKDKLSVMEAESNDDRKYAWHYELAEYRKRKRREMFYIVGAICGILSLLINIVLNYSKIKDIFVLILKNWVF